MKTHKTNINSVTLYNSSKRLYFNAFTLVELIVVIVILAILATIAFLSFNSYSSNSRDSVRLGDVNQLNKGIELYQVKAGYYPSPDGSISTGTINGINVTYKGEIGDNISRIINISKTPLDPLVGTRYTYGISSDKKLYQIASALEDGSNVSFDYSLGLIDGTNASGDPVSRVVGNYPGYIKYSSGSNVYITNIPSMIFNLSGSTAGVDLVADENRVFFIVDKNENLPYSINTTTVINSKGGNELIKELKGDAATLTGINITSIVTATTTEAKTLAVEAIFGTGGNIASSNLISCFGDSISVVKNIVIGGGSANVGGVVNSGTGGTAAVNGICGSSNTLVLYKSPTDNLCSTGTSSSVTGNGPWNWSCNGTDGGTTASCSSDNGDPYWNNVVTLLRLNGADGGTTFIDEKGKTVNNSTVVTKTAQSKFGGSSAYFNNSSHLTIPSNADFNFGTGNYTLEAWVMYDSTSGWDALFDLSTADILLRSNNGTYEGFGTSITPVSTWHHVALVRNNLVNTLYIDGEKKSSIVDVTNVVAGNLLIGAYYNSASVRLGGYMNDFRMTKGIARYTGDTYTVPNVQFPARATSPNINGVCGSSNGGAFSVTPSANLCSVGNLVGNVQGGNTWTWSCGGISGGANVSCYASISDPYWNNVVTLLRLNGTDGGTTFTDEKGKTVTTSSVVTTTAQSKFGGGSAYFNNASNLAIASHSDYNFGTGDFTVEAWIMYDTGATSGWHALFDLSNAKFLARTNNGNYEAFSPTTSIGGNLIWQHIAYVRNNGTMYLYIDGVQKGTYAHTTNITAGTLLIGAYYNNSHRFLGYMNELRITKGVARYSGSNFNVPMSKFPNN